MSLIVWSLDTVASLVREEFLCSSNCIEENGGFLFRIVCESCIFRMPTFCSAVKYEACSKSIRRDFFPRKLMKHGRCAVVGRWRVLSRACVDFFPPAYSVSRVQPACE